MAAYSPEVPVSTGLAATYNSAAGGGDKVPPGVIMHVKNGNAAVLTVTLVTPGIVDADLAIGDRTGTVPATTGERFFKIPTDAAYRDPADGLVSVTWSVTATVTFAVLSAG